MTRQEILNLYGIKMINRISTMSGIKEINKTFSAGGIMEGYFVIEFNTVESLEEDVIALIEHFIKRDNPPIDPDLGGSHADFATAYLDGVRFHNPYTGEITQIVPPEHFKTIAEVWRDFLLQPPLVGTI
jgi:hypothetical protein